MTLEEGRLYLLRGGHLVRYAGPNSGWGTTEALRKISVADARWLRVRYVSLKVRRMEPEAAWVLEIMAELGIEPSRIPLKHQPWLNSRA